MAGERFVDTVKLNPNLAEQLRSLVIMPRIRTGGAKEVCFGPLVLHLLGL